jgi:heptaprenylglyceryl phosphate synthase
MANRETKFDPDRAKSILADLATGNTRACAAGRAGVTDRTLRNWIARGKRGKKPFVSFVSAVKKAERDAEAFAVRSIVAAGRKNWTAHAWWLERKFPEDWSTNRAEVRALRKDVSEMLAQLRDLRGGPDANRGTAKGRLARRR